MIVIPAIDLLGGKCVRLIKGDFDQQTVFSNDPLSVARMWSDAGAPMLHLVDLDGARTGVPKQLHILRELANNIPIPIQWGGGLRDMEAIELALAAGAHRLVLSTAVIERPEVVASALQTYGPERLAVSIDTKEGRVAVRGWQRVTDVQITEVAQQLADLGLTWVIHTDVDRDGTLTEPNFSSIHRLVSLGRLRVIASGGISQWEHLEKLASLGCQAAIVGRALYTGQLKVQRWSV